MALYHLGLIGDLSADEVSRLSETLRDALRPLGIEKELAIAEPHQHFDPPADYSSTLVYVGGSGTKSDEAYLKKLMRGGTPVLPVVRDLRNFQRDIPQCLHAINGLALDAKDERFERLASFILGALHLLPRQRRLFLSYKRAESRDAALQLFEALSARQFDVFLDTHGVPPGDDFQDVLFHRLSDSDVLVMLDTPQYFDSRWTNVEIGKAMAKSLSIVRLGWPAVKQSQRLLAAESIQFDAADFEDKLLAADAIERASIVIERARSRCIALRTDEMVGMLASSVHRIGGEFLGLGMRRTATVRLHDGHRLLVFPAIGVPSAEHLHHVATVSGDADSRAVIYDDAGIAKDWQDHLEWLGGEVRSARWLKLGRAKWQLSTWSEDLAP